MMKRNKAVFLALVLVTLTWTGMAWAQAGADIPKPKLSDITVEGVINGMDCFAKGTTCPIDKHAIHVGIEKDWCLMSADGIFHLANVGPDVKVMHVGHTVRVTGKLEEVSKSIFVNKMEMMMKNGKFETVWTEHDHAKAMEESSWFHDMSK
jgi:hypothetical protein